MRVIRRDLGVAPLSRWISYGAAALGSLVLLVWYTQDLFLTLWTLIGITGICLIFGALAWALLKGGRVVGMQAKSSWRLALAGLQRRRGESTAQILIFGLAIMLLLVLIIIRTALIGEWRSQIPEDAANHFAMNIAEDEVAGLRELLADRATRRDFLFPMIRGRVLTVNGESARDWQNRLNREYQGVRLTSERSLTFAENVPENNVVSSGQWWNEDPDVAEVSLEADYAKDFNLSLGDELTFDVGGRQVVASVTNIRSLDWESMTPNFFIILSPSSSMEKSVSASPTSRRSFLWHLFLSYCRLRGSAPAMDLAPIAAMAKHFKPRGHESLIQSAQHAHGWGTDEAAASQQPD